MDINYYRYWTLFHPYDPRTVDRPPLGKERIETGSSIDETEGSIPSRVRVKTVEPPHEAEGSATPPEMEVSTPPPEPEPDSTPIKKTKKPKKKRPSK
jgi:hypothetical protein